MMQSANKTQQILYWIITQTYLTINVVEEFKTQSNVGSGINTDVTDNHSNNHGLNSNNDENWLNWLN